KFYRKGATHSGLLKTAQPLNKEAKDKLRDAWEEANTGLSNAQRIATFSNIEQQALDFIQNTLSPILIQYEEEFSYKVFSFVEQKRYYLKFNLTSLLRADQKSRAEFYNIMLDRGVFSINKVLELEDMDGIGEHGDKNRVDLNHVSI
ncbi:portal protein, partial [Bacillus cereus]